MKDKTIVHTVWIGCAIVVIVIVNNVTSKPTPLVKSGGGNGQYVAENFEDQ